MKVYFEKAHVIIREMIATDAEAFIKVFQSYGWHHEIETYVGYFKEQAEGIRKVYVAEYKHKVVGFCTLLLQAQNGPWKDKLPEISDLRVFNEFQKKGIGSILLDCAEDDASHYSDQVTLAVGLHAGYGNAQRIYAKRGYIPDGSGVWYKGKPLAPYEKCYNDDSLLLYMSKKLRETNAS